jgi:hypothetical protein
MASSNSSQTALRKLAQRRLPQYEQDDGPLSAKQMSQIKRRAKTGPKKTLRSSLADLLRRVG